VVVWKTSSNFEEPKIDFDFMPTDLRTWMMMVFEYLNIMFRFCSKHVLVYNNVGGQERAILYNLDQKTWDKIELLVTLMLQ